MADFEAGPLQHDDREAAADSFVGTVGKVVLGESWMGVMFVNHPDGNITVHRTTYQFPRDRLMRAVDQLRQMLQTEANEPPKPAALPMANFMRAVRKPQVEQESEGEDRSAE